MLRAQLYNILCKDVTFDLSIYTQELIKDDVVLELGVGTGRTVRNILANGFSCTGIDHDSDMIDFCQRQSELDDLVLVHDDISCFSLPQRFDQIQLPLRTLQLLPPQKQHSCLAQVSRHLKKNGRILIHISLWDPLEHTGIWRLHRILPTTEGGKLLIEESTLGTKNTLELCYKIQHVDQTQTLIASYIIHNTLYALNLQTLKDMLSSLKFQCTQLEHHGAKSEFFLKGERS